MPIRQTTVKLPMRMKMSMTQSRRSRYSVEIWLTVSASGSGEELLRQQRSMTNRTVSAPPIGIGR